MFKSFIPLLVLSMVCCWIEVDISVPGFPDMAKYFHVSENLIQYTLAVNFLGFGLSSLIVGPLSDAMGRRIVMVVGNGIMAIGAVSCFLANSIEWLLLSRFIQGLGASTSAIVTTAMIVDVYKGNKATKLIGTMNAVATVLIAIAPVLGGFINKGIGWRGNYGIVAIMSVISWILLLAFLPETMQERKNISRVKIIRDYIKLLKNREFLLTSISPSLLFAASMVFTASSAFLYMETFKFEIMTYCINQAIIVAAFSIMSFAYGAITKKFNISKIIYIGCFLVNFGAAFGLIAMLPWMVTFSMVIYACGFALYYPPVFTRSLEIFPEIKGTASSFIMSSRAFSVTCLVALGSNIYNGMASSIFIILLLSSLSVLIITLNFLKFKNNKFN